jgi:hypothetical protein
MSVFDSWKYARPSFSYRAWVYLNSYIYRGKNSYPLLSQDSFRFIADSVIENKEDITVENYKRISDSSVVYINSSYLEECLLNNFKFLKPRVIIAGGSDFDFYELKAELPSSVKLLLLQNSHISDGQRIQTLPIGMEDLDIGMNGIPRFVKSPVDWSQKSNRCLVGPFGLTHPDRLRISSTLGNFSNDFNLVENRLLPRDFNQLASRHKFVLCMRGNGEDTHRFWETLYRGSVPVVKVSAWSKSMEAIGIPLISVKSWEIDALKDALSYEVSPPPAICCQKYLWMEYWENLIKTNL